MDQQDRISTIRLNRFIRPGQSGCTCWTGGTDKRGYPVFWYRGKTLRASRVLWCIVYGSIPSGLIVRHKCDNPECLNIAHLELGTHQDNTDDAKARGRLTGPRKVTPDVIVKIKNMRRDRLTLKYIAESLGISISSVHFYSKRGAS